MWVTEALQEGEPMCCVSLEAGDQLRRWAQKHTKLCAEGTYSISTNSQTVEICERIFQNPVKSIFVELRAPSVYNYLGRYLFIK